MTTKINQALTEWIPGDIHSLKWFNERGIAQNMAYEYYQNGSLEKLGPGIYSRKNEKTIWEGGVRLLQQELDKKIHVAGRTALELHGHAHYVPMGSKQLVYLATYSKAKIPSWFSNINFECEFRLSNSSLFSSSFALEDYKSSTSLSLLISSREMAILELINTLDLSSSFETVENYMNSLQTLRTELVQKLLENCNSVKVKRVFLYLSEKLELPFIKKLKLKDIDLGRGKRQIVTENGQLDKKYQITVPRVEEENPF